MVIPNCLIHECLVTGQFTILSSDSTWLYRGISSQVLNDYWLSSAVVSIGYARSVSCVYAPSMDSITMVYIPHLYHIKMVS